MEKLYGIVMGQCTESLNWKLKTIKKISTGINTKKNEKPGKSLGAFQKHFRLAVQTLELAGGIE
eukprot:11450156-Ditylum_brightwellii.AAC.1